MFRWVIKNLKPVRLLITDLPMLIEIESGASFALSEHFTYEELRRSRQLSQLLSQNPPWVEETEKRIPEINGPEPQVIIQHTDSKETEKKIEKLQDKLDIIMKKIEEQSLVVREREIIKEAAPVSVVSDNTELMNAVKILGEQISSLSVKSGSESATYNADDTKAQIEISKRNLEMSKTDANFKEFTKDKKMKTKAQDRAKLLD